MVAVTRKDVRWLRESKNERRDPKDVRKVHRGLLEALDWEDGRYGDRRAFNPLKQQIGHGRGKAAFGWLRTA